MTDLLQHVRVVLVRPKHPGNIGAAARAMLNMGLGDLALVQPAQFPDPQATAMAAHASGLLERARVFDDLPAAVAGCQRVFAATARSRKVNCPVVDSPQLGRRMQELGGRHAVVFGPERTGLDNADLDLCHEIVSIPANPEYPAMNLAAAVQIICYALRCAAVEALTDTAGPAPAAPREQRLPGHGDMEAFHQHFAEVLARSEFLDARSNQTKALRRMRVMFNRAQPDVIDLRMLRGWLSALEKKLT